MSGENVNREPTHAASSTLNLYAQEQLLAAIALLLGPETGYQKRLQASQRLANTGPEVLPLFLRALQAYPEITLPAWPWWPPQYEQISRLLLHLSQQARLSLDELLQFPLIAQPPGPVLWTSVIGVAKLLPHAEYEPMLRAGLQAPWWTVRYAAVMAIAQRAEHISLCPETRQMLSQCQRFDNEARVRLIAACALLRCADADGLEILKQFLLPDQDVEYRKAALFILATELSLPLTPAQKQEMATLLLDQLQHTDTQITGYAARALGNIAAPSSLPALSALLNDLSSPACLPALITLEELASRKTLRYLMRQQFIPQQVAALLSTQEVEKRRQACYTLATIGGEYATAVLGTLILDDRHAAHLEAIEVLRFLPDTRNISVLPRIIRWLLHALVQPSETVQICALDSLSHLIWRASHQQKHGMLRILTQEVGESGVCTQLLSSSSSWLRKRTIELLGMLDPQLSCQRSLLLEMLHYDLDRDVRACIARVIGRAPALWAVPDLLLALLDSDLSVAEAALSALDELPLLDNALVVYAVKELAAYHLPIRKNMERGQLMSKARTWLKKHMREKDFS